MATLLENINARIAEHLAKRAAKQDELEALVAAVETENRSDLTADEKTKLSTLRDEIKALDADEEFAELQTRAAELEEDEQRKAKAAAIHVPAPAKPAPESKTAGVGGATVRSEPRTYEGERGAGQYLKDIVRANPAFGFADSSALERLQRHAQELRVDFGDKLAAEARALGQMERRDVGRSTDAELGYLVPPLYAISDYAIVARAGRPFADASGPRPLPGGIDAVNIPRFTTGTLTAVQNGDGAAITTRDVVTAETTASLVTVGGYIDVNVQAIDQAPVDTQAVLFQDLESDLAMQEDTLLISGSAASGQPMGVLNLQNINTETYTDASPTPAELYPKVGEAVSKIHANRYMPAEVIFMHPTRWAWLTSVIASDGRPFAGLNPTAMNVGIIAERVVAENLAGSMMNLPVVLDANIPANLGTGTNEDRIIVSRITDSRLWEGTVRMQALPVVDATSETLTVRLKLWRYLIHLPGRYPKSWTVVSGTGLATPTF